MELSISKIEKALPQRCPSICDPAGYGRLNVTPVIRIPAGAVLAAATFSDVDPALMLAAGLVGGTIASGSHFTKAGSRAVINTSPEPFSNWLASFSEEAVVLGGLWAMFLHPVAFLVLLVLFLCFAAWLLPKFWRGIKLLAQRIRGEAAAPRPR